MPANQSTTSWTTAKMELLRRLVTVEELTSGEVALAMGFPFTRSAVIGKAVRMKLRWARAGRAPRTQEEDKRHRRESRRAERAARGAKPRAIRIPGESRPEPIIMAPEMKQLTLMELGELDCRWPIGVGRYGLYCGAAQDVDSSYCPFHAHASVRRNIPMDRRAKEEKTRELRRAYAAHIRESMG